ncbi:MAG: class I poly(R)-hydroxyalkanoic acid synthase, partial [Alphaproteobacteria bacterium]|nr:class I poly(R)-hydroxyalkanoic acid synthase [Alphaproteobacteria bacterium]
MPRTQQAADAFARNMQDASEQYQQIVQELFATPAMEGISAAPPPSVGNAFMEFYAQLFSDPSRLLKSQADLWQNYMNLWQDAAQQFMGQAPESAPSSDRRFRDDAWAQNPLFHFIQQAYLLTSQSIMQSVQEVEGLDPQIAKKVDFYTKQFVDAMSPSNFAATNPQVMKATLESNGENLVRGMKNFLTDLRRGHGKLAISMTDYKAFHPGENIAATPGKVVFRNELMELIQYAPTTKEVHQRPLLIIPAWINKFYILDLSPENSMAKYMVDKGYTVFVVSWVNPDEHHRDVTFDEYMTKGALAALDAIEQATGEREVLAAGYCLGGTLLAITMAWMAAKGDDRIKAATFLTTMIDFAEPGQLGVFIDDEQVTALEERMQARGYLDASEMSTTFNMLRANELIWSFVVNNYLLGKDPFPFDLLYWNSDNTRLPCKMHSFYLRKMYIENRLKDPGGITIGGVKIDLSKIKTPAYILSTREDHIAPWQSTYKTRALLGGPSRFVLAGSGHVAGVVNPPAKKKYSYWVNDAAKAESPDRWLESAAETPGSWWPDWEKWSGKFTGKKVPARIPGKGKLKAHEDAP